LDQAAEILLVEMAARDRFDRALEFGQGELRRHQLEDYRAVFQLGAKTRDAGGEDAAVVEAHGDADRRRGFALRRDEAPVAFRLRDEADFVQELVAIENALLVPARAFLAEGEAHPLGSPEGTRRI